MNTLGALLYSNENFTGQVFNLNIGNYNNVSLFQHTKNNAIFSLRLSPYTKIRMYGGNTFNMDNIGSIVILNPTNKYIDIPSFPSNLAGNIKSISITKINEIEYDASDITVSSDKKYIENFSNENDYYLLNITFICIVTCFLLFILFNTYFFH